MLIHKPLYLANSIEGLQVLAAKSNENFKGIKKLDMYVFSCMYVRQDKFVFVGFVGLLINCTRACTAIRWTRRKHTFSCIDLC